MTEFGLEPAFVKIDYTTAFGAHSCLVCTRAFNPVPVTGNMGSYLNWNGINIDGEAMIDELVDRLADRHLDSTSINQATVFTKADEDSPSVPVANKAYAVDGTIASPMISRAVSKTFNFRTTDITAAKLIILA